MVSRVRAILYSHVLLVEKFLLDSRQLINIRNIQLSIERIIGRQHLCICVQMQTQMQMQFEYEGGCCSCAWPTDPLSRASACGTFCHDNVKPHKDTHRRASSFHFHRFYASRSGGTSRFRLKRHNSTLQLHKWPRRDPSTRPWTNVDSLRDYGRGLCTRL